MTTGVTGNKSLEQVGGKEAWKGRVDPSIAEGSRGSCQFYHGLVALFSPSGTVPSHPFPRGQPSWVCPNLQACPSGACSSYPWGKPPAFAELD